MLLEAADPVVTPILCTSQGAVNEPTTADEKRDLGQHRL
jgi:hypothetical protein